MSRREQRRATRETAKSDAKLNFTNASLANTLNETAHKAFIRGVEQGIAQGVTSTVSAYTIALVEAYNFTEQQAREVFDTVSKEVFGNMSRTKETKPGQFTLDELKDMAKNCGVEV